jgi:hypothetical protein
VSWPMAACPFTWRKKNHTYLKKNMKKINNVEMSLEIKAVQSAMSIQMFWSIVEQCKNFEQPEVDLENILKKLSPEEIAAYKWHFENLVLVAYRWDMWGAAYLLYDGCSDDGFFDFLYGLIAQGKEMYESAVKNPDSLTALWGKSQISNETFCYVPKWVYEEMTGNKLPADCWQVPGTLESDFEIDHSMNEDWDFDSEIENKKHLPKLSALCYAECATQ